jgi:hypothetical protein
LRQIARVPQCVRRRSAFWDKREIQHREKRHKARLRDNCDLSEGDACLEAKAYARPMSARQNFRLVAVNLIRKFASLFTQNSNAQEI